jgi:transcription termination factor Rho
MHLSELKAQHVSELIKMGEALEIENVARLRKQELMFAIMKKRAKAGEQVFGDGVLEVLPDGFGFLRSIEASYMASAPTTSTCRPARSAASTCTPAT